MFRQLHRTSQYNQQGLRPPQNNGGCNSQQPKQNNINNNNQNQGNKRDRGRVGRGSGRVNNNKNHQRNSPPKNAVPQKANLAQQFRYFMAYRAQLHQQTEQWPPEDNKHENYEGKERHVHFYDDEKPENQ